MHLAMLQSLEEVRRATPTMQTVPDQFPPEIKIRTLSSAAMDMHTGLGRLAIKAFYTSLCKDYPVIAKIYPEKAVRALGAAVFVVEGGQVDRRMRTPNLMEWKHRQDRALMIRYGVPEEIVVDVLVVVHQEIERLNSKRVWASELNG
jgi:hypothetical protein